jgi:hypothetical protein
MHTGEVSQRGLTQPCSHAGRTQMPAIKKHGRSSIFGSTKGTHFRQAETGGWGDTPSRDGGYPSVAGIWLSARTSCRGEPFSSSHPRTGRRRTACPERERPLRRYAGWHSLDEPVCQGRTTPASSSA